MKKFDTGAIVLLPDKIQGLRETGQLGLMIMPPHLRDAQLLTIFDPINNINTEAIHVERWEPVREDSHLCKPVGLELRVIDPIDVPERLWADCNHGVMGSPELNSCQGLNFAAHTHDWQSMQNCNDDPAAYHRLLLQAIEQLGWEQDDPQYRSDAAFCQNLHVMDDATKLNYIGGGVKTFSVRCPWK